jgi:hypothetical protein
MIAGEAEVSSRLVLGRHSPCTGEPFLSPALPKVPWRASIRRRAASPANARSQQCGNWCTLGAVSHVGGRLVKARSDELQNKGMKLTKPGVLEVAAPPGLASWSRVSQLMPRVLRTQLKPGTSLFTKHPLEGSGYPGWRVKLERRPRVMPRLGVRGGVDRERGGLLRGGDRRVMPLARSAGSLGICARQPSVVLGGYTRRGRSAETARSRRGPEDLLETRLEEWFPRP